MRLAPDRRAPCAGRLRQANFYNGVDFMMKNNAVIRLPK